MASSLPASERRITAERLEAWVAGVLEAVGMRSAEARVVASSLVAADLRGVRTHGVTRLPIYVQRIRAGVLNPTPDVAVERRGSAVAVVDADDGPGQLAGQRAMQLAVELAREAGAGVVSVRRSAHFGAAAWYTLQAAEAGMAGLALSQAEADVVPFGGREPAIGTNPLSLAVPGDPPVVVDMATSGVAMGRVLLARRTGEAIPEGWAVDERGDSTTDPSSARALLPLGGPKGYGLAVLIDLLSGALSGQATGRQVRRMYDDFAAPQGVGHLLAAIDVARFLPLPAFRDAVTALADELRANLPAEGIERVLVPGELEAAAEGRHRADGIPIDASLRAELEAVGADVGVPFISAE